jgi:TRAP-type C4-dicarboxylate transport system substrate-binding protein
MLHRYVLPAALAAMALCGPALAQDVITMKLATVVVNDPIHQWMDEYKKRIEARTNGRIKAEVYPASQLGIMTRLVEGLQLGTIEMAVSASTFYSPLHPAIQVPDAPGIFADIHHAQRVVTDPAFREKFVRLAEPRGVYGVSLWVYGGAHYASMKPIRTLDDFKGKKLRTLASKIETEILAKVGATGIPIPFAEMIPGLQQGTIDGVRGNVVVLAGPKMYTVAKSITLLDEAFLATMAGLSVPFRNKLPADLRKTVDDVGRELDQWGYENYLEKEKTAAQIWKDNGAEVITISAADRTELTRRMAPIGDELLGTNPQTAEMWTLVKQVAAKHRK